jgi:uncharacterized membrane protein YagU involved in acid resistance
MSRPDWLVSLVAGMLAGCAATVPMTALMEVMRRRRPPHERYRPTPIAITSRAAAKLGLRQHVPSHRWSAASLASHFTYGASMGALYAAVAQFIRLPPLLAGAVYGLIVWAGGYLGWVPALGLYRRSTQQPKTRRRLNIWSHLVWGVTLDVLWRGLGRLWRGEGCRLR